MPITQVLVQKEVSNFVIVLVGDPETVILHDVAG
jgi:hypothetical protein